MPTIARSRSLHRLPVRRGLLLLVALVAVAAAACVPPAPPHELDVDNPPLGVQGGLVTSSQWQHAQTFTAGTTGYLDHVNVWVTHRGSQAGDLVVSIHKVVGDHETGALIGSGTHRSTVIGEVGVRLDLPASVVAGRRYVVVLRGTMPAIPGSTEGSWQLSFNSDMPIPGEKFYVEYDMPPQVVFLDPANSLAFRTFVRPLRHS